MRFFFFSVYCMFDKNQKSCATRIHFVTDEGLYKWKAFYKIKFVFIHPLWMITNLSVNKTVKFSVWKLQTHFSKNVFFIDCDIFSRVNDYLFVLTFASSTCFIWFYDLSLMSVVPNKGLPPFQSKIVDGSREL